MCHRQCKSVDEPNHNQISRQISTEGGTWRTLCDASPPGASSSSWGPQEANVACRQLGYGGGHLHAARGNGSGVGDLRAALAAAVAAMEFSCDGEEATLGECRWRNRSVSE